MYKIKSLPKNETKIKSSPCFLPVPSQPPCRGAPLLPDGPSLETGVACLCVPETLAQHLLVSVPALFTASDALATSGVAC